MAGSGIRSRSERKWKASLPLKVQWALFSQREAHRCASRCERSNAAGSIRRSPRQSRTGHTRGAKERRRPGSIAMWFLQDQPIDRQSTESPPESLIRNNSCLVLMSVIALALFSMYLAQPLTPNFLSGIRGLSLSQVGLLFTAGAVGNSLMAILFSRVEPRHGFIYSQVLVMLFALIIWQATTLPIFALGYFLLGGFRVSRPMAMTQARELVHDLQMVITYGTMENLGAAIIVTPPIAGILFEGDPLMIYPLAIGLISISLVVSYVFLPRKPGPVASQIKQDTASVPESE